MGKGKEIMIGVADTTDNKFFPYYATLQPGSRTVEQIAYTLAKQCFKSKKFVYASFPKKTKWQDADKKMLPLWKEHHSSVS